MAIAILYTGLTEASSFAAEKNYTKQIQKIYGDHNFYVLENKSPKKTYKFSSSNHTIANVHKNTGYCVIKGPGQCILTVKIKDKKTKKTTVNQTTLTVKPSAIKNILATKGKGNILFTTWKKDNKNSGYEIEVSNNKTFITVLTSKVIKSGSVSSASIKLKTELFNNYVRIRAYKHSNGTTVYGPYNFVKIK